MIEPVDLDHLHGHDMLQAACLGGIVGTHSWPNAHPIGMLAPWTKHTTERLACASSMRSHGSSDVVNPSRCRRHQSTCAMRMRLAFPRFMSRTLESSHAS